MSGRKLGPSSDRPPVQSAWMARWGDGEARGVGVSSREGEGYREAGEGRVIEFMGGREGVGELRSGKIGTWSGGIGNVGDSSEEMLPPVLALAPPGGAGSGLDRGKREIGRPVGSSSNRALDQSFRGDENIQSREFVGGGGGGFQRMLSHSGVRIVPRESRYVEGTGLFEELYGRSSVLPRMPSSVCDMETMRIYKTIGTVAEPARCNPRFSQTTHHFFIRKKSDVVMARGDEVVRRSTVSSEKKAVRELTTLPPDVTFLGRKGLTLESLDGSTEIEEKGKGDTVKSSVVGSRNESSTETYNMDMDALRVNNRNGIAWPSLNMDAKEDEQTRQISSSLGTSLREKSQGRMPTSELPDINKPAVPDMAVEAGKDEASTSGTQSLDVDCFAPNAKSSMKRSGSERNGTSGSDPCSRWVKRLKPTSSDAFPYGTKISIRKETSLHQKVSNFRNILGCDKRSSELVNNKADGREMTVINQTGVSTRKSKSQSRGSGKESQDVKLSHAWIQRWCHNSAALSGKKHGSLIFSERQGSKAADYDRKQFPSIAAMALMGKAMNGFPPCKLGKSGSLSVWKTVGY